MAEACEPLTGWDSVQCALGEIHACTADFDQFFAGVFRELEALSGDLQLRGRQVSAVCREQQHDEQTAVDERDAEFAALLAQMQSQMTRLTETAADLAAVQAVVGVPQPVADEHDEDRARAERIERDFCALAQQHAALERERAAMETELDLIRSRAAELSEAMTEQKRLALVQQAGWNEELQHMRQMLEQLTERLVEQGTPASAAASPPPVPAEPRPPATPAKSVATAPPPADDPVLGSVVAQFAMLQRDKLRRRAGQS